MKTEKFPTDRQIREFIAETRSVHGHPARVRFFRAMQKFCYQPYTPGRMYSAPWYVYGDRNHAMLNMRAAK